MSQAKIDSEDEMRAEYDFSGAVRGKHHEAYKNRGLMLDPAREQASVKESAPRIEALRTGSGSGSAG